MTKKISLAIASTVMVFLFLLARAYVAQGGLAVIEAVLNDEERKRELLKG